MLHEWFEWTINKLIFRPLYKLYTLVWWRNHSDTHICTALSPGTTNHFWDAHYPECQDMIYTQFQGIYTIVSCGLWFFFLHQIYLIIWHKCIIARTHRNIMRDAVRTAIRDVRESGLSIAPRSTYELIPNLDTHEKGTSTESPV